MKKVLVILAVLAMTGVASAALLSNPEAFEAPNFSDGLLNGQAGWEGWGSGSGSTTGGWAGSNDVATISGGEVTVGNLPAWNWWGLGIAINHGNPVAPGPVTLAFDVIEGAASGIVKIEYYDDLARTTQLGIDAWDPANMVAGPTAYFGTAPAGTNYATIVIGAFNEAVTIDNVSIPEPATMALLGLGGLLLRRKK